MTSLNITEIVGANIRQLRLVPQDVGSIQLAVYRGLLTQIDYMTT